MRMSSPGDRRPARCWGAKVGRASGASPWLIGLGMGANDARLCRRNAHPNSKYDSESDLISGIAKIAFFAFYPRINASRIYISVK